MAVHHIALEIDSRRSNIKRYHKNVDSGHSSNRIVFIALLEA